MKTKILIALVFCLGLGGCSTPGSYHVQSPPLGKAAIYLFRPSGIIGCAGTVQVTIDGELVGTLGLKTFLCAYVEPGSHEIKSTIFALSGQGSAGLYPSSVYLKDGSVAYMKGGFGLGPLLWRFHPIPEKEGLKLLNSYKFAGKQ